LTIPPDNNSDDDGGGGGSSSGCSFAFIVSIEDPGVRNSDVKLVCIQVIGPDDRYVIQADTDDAKFWAGRRRQRLGCNFEYYTANNSATTAPASTTDAVAQLPFEEWWRIVESGFQISVPDGRFVGKIRGHDGTIVGSNSNSNSNSDKTSPPATSTIAKSKSGVPLGMGDCSCDFDFVVTPVCGWGERRQKSTGGWLASFEVFEPHWQVTLADANATGYVKLQNRTYRFENASFYVSLLFFGVSKHNLPLQSVPHVHNIIDCIYQAEKNWGAALPSKWYWTQCNTFDGYKQLSVTAGGGIRKIPFGRTEALGMVSVHYDGKFYEGVPWLGGAMEWKVSTWGSWELRGNSTYGDRPFEAVVTYKCDPETTPGLVFRAPTPDQGMVYFCRDTFVAHTSLTLWELEWDGVEKGYVRKPGPPLINNATSSQGGAEIGGGPWWDTWEGQSKLKQPIKALLEFPARVRAFRRHILKSRDAI